MNIRWKTINLLDRNTGRNTLSLGDDFFRYDSKNKGNKSKNNTEGLLQKAFKEKKKTTKKKKKKMDGEMPASHHAMGRDPHGEALTCQLDKRPP